MFHFLYIFNSQKDRDFYFQPVVIEKYSFITQIKLGILYYVALLARAKYQYFTQRKNRIV